MTFKQTAVFRNFFFPEYRSTAVFAEYNTIKAVEHQIFLHFEERDTHLAMLMIF